MDEGLSEAVKEVFVRLYQEGLIYRSHYIINWCPRCQTALSDLEVEHQEIVGKLYHLKYPFKEGDRFLVVATTRPETMLGDTAVAVNPEDERYQEVIGKKDHPSRRRTGRFPSLQTPMWISNSGQGPSRSRLPTISMILRSD